MVSSDRNRSDATDAGAAYIFVRSGGVWYQQAKLTASDAAETDYFGISVAISVDTVLVGAYYDDEAGGFGSGSRVRGRPARSLDSGFSKRRSHNSSNKRTRTFRRMDALRPPWTRWCGLQHLSAPNNSWSRRAATRLP